MADTSNRASDLEFAADLFKAADKLRGNLEPSEYKHVALGLIFLKYISDAFDVLHAKLSEATNRGREAQVESRWVPEGG